MFSVFSKDYGRVIRPSTSSVPEVYVQLPVTVISDGKVTVPPILLIVTAGSLPWSMTPVPPPVVFVLLSTRLAWTAIVPRIDVY